MIALRPIQVPADQQAVLRLDTSFTTERVYRVYAAPPPVDLEVRPEPTNPICQDRLVWDGP